MHVPAAEYGPYCVAAAADVGLTATRLAANVKVAASAGTHLRLKAEDVVVS